MQALESPTARIDSRHEALPAPRWTACGDPRAEARIRDDLRQIAEDARGRLGTELIAWLLVGSYARAEGGVVDRNGALGPANDYDLVAVVRSKTAEVRAALHAMEKTWSERTGVAVDVWPLERKALESPPATLFWLDVAQGAGRVLVGDDRILASVRKLCARDVPHEEIARLLANRAVGLALSRLDRQGAREEGPVVREGAIRHAQKAILACGDAQLLLVNRYPGTVEARVSALRSLAGSPAISPAFAEAYATAAVGRVRPDLFEFGQAWIDETHELVGRFHLAFERDRRGTPLDAAGYGSTPIRLFPELRDARFGAIPAAASAYAAGIAPFGPRPVHPRERLARVAMLLAHGDENASKIALRWLGMPAASSPAAIRRRLVGLASRGG